MDENHYSFDSISFSFLKDSHLCKNHFATLITIKIITFVAHITTILMTLIKIKIITTPSFLKTIVWLSFEKDLYKSHLDVILYSYISIWSELSTITFCYFYSVETWTVTFSFLCDKCSILSLGLYSSVQCLVRMDKWGS